MTRRACVLTTMAAFACGSFASAQSVPSAPPQASLYADVPVQSKCALLKNVFLSSAAVAKQGIIAVTLTSVSDKKATRVRLAISDSGTHVADYEYSGELGAKATTQFKTRIGAIADPSSLSCSVSYVELQDGSSWSMSDSNAPAPETTDPIMLDSCVGYAVNEYTAAVGISFHATTRVATAVSFVFGVQDPFGSIASWYSGTTVGNFSPGVTIEPRKPALNPTAFQSRSVIPQNPAWSFPISQSGSPESIRCVVYKVRLSDGSVWANPVLTNVFPIPANE